MPVSKKKITTIFLHSSVWALFMLLPVLFLPNPASLDFQVPPKLPLIFLLSFGLLLTVFYGNYYFLIPQIARRHGALIYVVCSLLLISFFVFIQFKVRTNMLQDIGPFGPYRIVFKRFGLLVLSGLNCFVWAVSTGLWLLEEWQKSERRLRESEQKQVETELVQLKKQINPHFLFNTLNSIYALALTKDEQAPKSVLKLSQLMSYMLTDAQEDLVPLQKEINHLQSYISLQRLRLSDSNELKVQFEGDFSTQQIAPLLLLPFVENTFKYGVSNTEATAIEIQIKAEAQRLYFFSRNQVMKSSTQGTGLGIPNTRRRLELIYPKSHQLEIQQEKNEFIVQLRIDLKKEI